MKLFRFENNGKCGCCNWATSKVYILAENEKEAKTTLEEFRENEGNGLCGNCIADLLADENYTIINKEGKL